MKLEDKILNLLKRIAKEKPSGILEVMKIANKELGDSIKSIELKGSKKI